MITKVAHYTGSHVTYQLEPGTYLFELWGASGGSKSDAGGRGSYVSGIINFGRKTSFHVYVGQKGVINSTTKTFNGGGAGSFPPSWGWPNSYTSSDGGATDIRLDDSNDSFKSLKSRILVAAGGGGEVYYQQNDPSIAAHGGNGGALNGFPGSASLCSGCIPSTYTAATGGSQKSPGIKGGGPDSRNGMDGEFGSGGDGYGGEPSSGGGGGYFGGGGGGVTFNTLGSGAGGSSFISGYSQCSAVTNESTSTNISFRGCVHYSGLAFESGVMKSGNEEMFTITQETTKGNPGNGAARITLISKKYNGRYSYLYLKQPTFLPYFLQHLLFSF